MNVGAIVVSLIALAGTGLSAWLAARAQRTSAKVQEKASLFEGYDEFVAHLRARVTELEEGLEAAAARFESAKVECEECRDLLRKAQEDYQALRMVLELLRRELGFPPGWDPFDHLEQTIGIRPFGRRSDDPPVPPPGWPGREHWTNPLELEKHPDEGDPDDRPAD